MQVPFILSFAALKLQGLDQQKCEMFCSVQENGEKFFPCWFKLRSLTSQQQEGADHWLGSPLVRLPKETPPALWEFTGSYWEAKHKLEWVPCPDIYSGGPETG